MINKSYRSPSRPGIVRALLFLLPQDSTVLNTQAVCHEVRSPSRPCSSGKGEFDFGVEFREDIRKNSEKPQGSGEWSEAIEEMCEARCLATAFAT